MPIDLIDAVINQDVAKVKELLEQGANPNETDDWTNVTPMHFAAQHNLIDIAMLLIGAGAKIDIRDGIDHETALDVAKIHGHKEMVALLTNLQQKLISEGSC